MPIDTVHILSDCSVVYFVLWHVVLVGEAFLEHRSSFRSVVVDALVMKKGPLRAKDIGSRFRSCDLWVMGPPRFHCAIPMMNALSSCTQYPFYKYINHT